MLNCKRLTVLAVAFSLAVFFSVTALAKGGITIKGTIANLDRAEKFISRDTYLQLISFPKNNQVSFETDKRGRTKYSSNLAKIDLPPNGVFSFNLKELKPGRYLIVIQLMEAAAMSRGVSPILFSKESNQPASIDITELSHKTTIDLGQVIIRVP